MTIWIRLPKLSLNRLAFAPLVLLLASCSAPEATIQLGSSLSILSAGTSFSADTLPDDWFKSGTIPKDGVAVSASLGSSTLSVTSAERPYLAARRIRANVLATPYLSWRWRLQPGTWEYHPVRLIVGFAGGSTETVEQGTLAKLFPGTSLPTYDRVMSLLWAPSALVRGTLIGIETEDQILREAHYTVRGGPENVGVWWNEAVDLATLYRRSWPDDQINQSRVAFIGVASTASKKALTVYISDLRLSR